MPAPSRLALALSLALTACGDASGDSPGDAPAAGGLTLTADGAGRLGAETALDSAAVRAALPAGFVTERHAGPDGAPAVWALRDGQIVFEVTGGETVTRIDAPSEAVTGPGGVRPGQTFAEAGGDRLDCALGTGDLRDSVVCRVDGVDLVFASEALAGKTALPPAATLASAVLDRLVWRADG
ncbi:MAG TPA: DUF1131 family protein [Rubricoccaceae bacterium]|jgi:hypothetical protein